MLENYCFFALSFSLLVPWYRGSFNSVRVASTEGAFRFEYASDNGLAAGEVIEPDGSRVGAYQYKDPSGQLVKLKYRAGKGGFQVSAHSHSHTPQWR